MDASFSSFLRAEEKDRLGPGGKPPAGVDVIVQGTALHKGSLGVPPEGKLSLWFEGLELFEKKTLFG